MISHKGVGTKKVFETELHKKQTCNVVVIEGSGFDVFISNLF